MLNNSDRFIKAMLTVILFSMQVPQAQSQIFGGGTNDTDGGGAGGGGLSGITSFITCQPPAGRSFRFGDVHNNALDDISVRMGNNPLTSSQFDFNDYLLILQDQVRSICEDDMVCANSIDTYTIAAMNYINYLDEFNVDEDMNKGNRRGRRRLNELIPEHNFSDKLLNILEEVLDHASLETEEEVILHLERLEHDLQHSNSTHITLEEQIIIEAAISIGKSSTSYWHKALREESNHFRRLQEEDVLNCIFRGNEGGLFNNRGGNRHLRGEKKRQQKSALSMPKKISEQSNRQMARQLKKGENDDDWYLVDDWWDPCRDCISWHECEVCYNSNYDSSVHYGPNIRPSPGRPTSTSQGQTGAIPIGRDFYYPDNSNQNRESGNNHPGNANPGNNYNYANPGNNYNNANPGNNYNNANPGNNYNNANPGNNYNNANPGNNYNNADPGNNQRDQYNYAGNNYGSDYNNANPGNNYNYANPGNNYNYANPSNNQGSQYNYAGNNYGSDYNPTRNYGPIPNYNHGGSSGQYVGHPTMGYSNGGYVSGAKPKNQYMHEPTNRPPPNGGGPHQGNQLHNQDDNVHFPNDYDDFFKHNGGYILHDDFHYSNQNPANMYYPPRPSPNNPGRPTKPSNPANNPASNPANNNPASNPTNNPDNPSGPNSDNLVDNGDENEDNNPGIIQTILGFAGNIGRTVRADIIGVLVGLVFNPICVTSGAISAILFSSLYAVCFRED